jgi:DNA-binding MarR family transcriptional regulator
MNFITYKNLVDKYNREIDTAIQDEIRPFCYRHKITYLQYQILEVLYEEGEMTIGDISEIMSMDTGNMSAQCKRLEQKGYTTRIRKKFDERVVDVSLSRQGRLVVRELNDILNRRYKSKWEKLPEEEKQLMLDAYEVMKKLFVSKTSKKEKVEETPNIYEE